MTDTSQDRGGTLGDVHPDTAVVKIYQDRSTRAESASTLLSARDRWYSIVRNGLSLTFIGLLFLTMLRFRPALAALVALLFLAVVVVAWLQERVARQLAMVLGRATINRRQAARCNRQWSQIWVAQPPVPPQWHQVALDLDLFGKASLWQLISRAHTSLGKQTLVEWLFERASVEEIQARQRAVAALTDPLDFREEIELNAQLLADRKVDPHQFLEWLNGSTWLRRRPTLLAASRILTILMIILPCAIWWQFLPAEWFLAVLGLVAVNVGMNVAYVGQVHDIFNLSVKGSYETKYYSTLFRAVSQLPADGGLLDRLRNKMEADGKTFESVLRPFCRLAHLASGRSSSLFGIPYLIAQTLWLWDFHVLDQLEKWQDLHRDDLQEWFAAVGELEAVCSLASVAHDHPDWCVPQFVNEPVFTATDLGHPLLPPGHCVRNDVQVGPPGSLLLVTGSNMSGKSTLLRSIGINALLATAGGHVCGRRLTLKPLAVTTSMRNTDSLESGTSFFMAELQRLKTIVNQAESASSPEARPLLYLLDEILQGTNSAERRIAVVQVLQHLLSQSAIGAISTHDLGLATDEDLIGHANIVHFRESFAGEGDQRHMTFDYRMRPGVAPTTNALQLLDMVGLGRR